MDLKDEQWGLILPHIPIPQKKDGRGRPRRDNREILNGVLWILRTGAQWKDLPERYPPYQTCHRRYQEWILRKVFDKILTVLAQDMEKRGKIKLEECFIDGTFSAAKKGGLWWVKPSAARGQKSWQWQIKRVFQSPSIWPALLRMKSSWWKQRLSKNLRNEIRETLSVIAPTTPTRLTRNLKRKESI